MAHAGWPGFEVVCSTVQLEASTVAPVLFLKNRRAVGGLPASSQRTLKIHVFKA